MKKKLIMMSFIGFILVFQNTGFGFDQVKLGFKGGLGIGQVFISNDNIRGGIFSPIGGIAFDLTSAVLNSKSIRWGIELDVMYQERGGEFNGYNERINYLGFPLILKFGLRDLYFIGLGLNYQRKLASATYRVKDDNLEFVLQLGIERPIAEDLFFVFDMRWNMGLLDYSKEVSETYYTFSYEFLFGLMFKL